MHAIPSFSLYFMFFALGRSQKGQKAAKRGVRKAAILYCMKKERKKFRESPMIGKKILKEEGPVLVMIFFAFAQKKHGGNHHRQGFRRNSGQPNSIQIQKQGKQQDSRALKYQRT